MIKNIMLLTKISTKNVLENYNLIDKNTKRINKKSIYVWLILIVIIAIAYLSNELLKTLAKYGQLDIFLNIDFALMTILMFIQVASSCMNILYFSKDIELLLPFPIKPEELLLSRTNTMVNILYGTEIIFMLIPLMLYGSIINASLYYYLGLILVLILLPIFPTLLVSIVMLLAMNFKKKIKNRNFFQFIITLCFVILIIVLEVLFLKMAFLDSNNIDINLNLISEQINKSMVAINPLISILNQNNILINLLQILVLYAIMYGILIFIGKKVYIKNILKTTEYVKAKVNQKLDLNKKCNPKSVIKAYIENEFRNLLRSAIFVIKTIYPICMLIIMMIVITISIKINVIQKNQEMSDWFGGLNLTIEGVCIILGIAQILFSIVGISISAISRQGKNAVFMKYIPISMYKQFVLKNIMQISVNIITVIALLVCSKMLFSNISILSLISIFIISIILSILNSYLMLIVDIKRPILNWNSEIDVFKQNGNKIFQYVWTIIVVVILMYITRAFKDLDLYLGIFVTFIIFVSLLVIVDIFVRKQIKKNKLFKNII